MKYYQSPYGPVALPDERVDHILFYHPDAKPFLSKIKEALQSPELTVPSEKDPSVIVCYRLIPRRKRYLAVVIKVGPHPFVVTAYLTKKPKRATL